MTTEFNGNLKDAIVAMLSSQVTECEITQNINGVEVTVIMNITKIVDDGVVMYDVTGEAAK